MTDLPVIEDKPRTFAQRLALEIPYVVQDVPSPLPERLAIAISLGSKIGLARSPRSAKMTTREYRGLHAIVGRYAGSLNL